MSYLTYEEIELILDSLDLLDEKTKEMAGMATVFKNLGNSLPLPGKDKEELESSIKAGLGKITAKRESIILLKAKLVRLKDSVLVDDLEKEQ